MRKWRHGNARLAAVVIVLLGATAGGQEAIVPQAGGALAAYVAKADSSYGWETRARYAAGGVRVVELGLRSQTWRDQLWKHQLLLIRPDRVAADGHALLIIGGGRWRDEYETAPASSSLPDGAELFVEIAQRLKTVVAVVGQVPYQPLFGLTEDRLIAYTFDQYLRTADTEWPLLLPMVKSAVRAMDAASEAALGEWGAALETFTVLGGSKRGWTAWLAGAVDTRITALAPAVLDALNMAEHFPYQTLVWGEPSEEIRPYTELDLDDILASERGAGLRAIVDPFSYRAALTQPKLVILATNDRYFPVDSANLYWDALHEPKYLLYLPNEQHSIDDYTRLVRTLRALHAATAANGRLPQLEWEYRWAADAVTLCVRSDARPRTLRVWMAASDDRDFRDAVWKTGADLRRAARRGVQISRPATGHVAVFAEATFDRARSTYSLSTNVAVLAAPTARDDRTHPRGTPGVCEPAAP